MPVGNAGDTEVTEATGKQASPADILKTYSLSAKLQHLQ